MPKRQAPPEIAEYAVNLADLTTYYRAGKFHPVKSLLDPVLSDVWITAEDRLDGAAVVLACPLNRARAILSVVRKKIPQYALRFYVRQEGRSTWSRV